MGDRNDLSGMAERLAASRAALSAVRPGIEAGEPWPLSAAYGTEPESDWGPKEVLAHVAEMIPYWLRQADRVLGAPAEAGPTPFGRVASDPDRIERIGSDRKLAAAALFDAIDEALGTAIQRVEALRPAEAARQGSHPRLGDMTVGALLERFLAAHLDEHVRSLETMAAAR